ncbi:hypothetical protein [Hydrogenophaga pseudoflava]|uniref:hypothetical protein n=1 Tax=Hydrogenophaga pseudoflava TaxID=47421 RepID=UPI0027E46376|nr:hypothetical protein [Hydrogenophaga pseudoflava]MDQ7742973.1 hypothetical protein [Hydrogenophaga pseudoflava]
MSGGDWKEMFNAGCAGDLALVEHHVKSGVDVNYAHPEFLSTPLVAAILAGQEAVALYLLDHGANPALASEFDAATPLQAARQMGLVAVEEKLYAMGVPRPPAGAGEPLASPASRTLALAAAVVYLALFVSLVMGVVYGLGLHCEGFGCMGLGVYWFTWSVVYAVSGLIGLWARSLTRSAAVAGGLVRWAVRLHLLMGLVLLVLWWIST